MYIKVISVLELFKGIVTIVIIALEPSIFPRSFHLFSVVTVVGARVEVPRSCTVCSNKIIDVLKYLLLKRDLVTVTKPKSFRQFGLFKVISLRLVKIHLWIFDRLGKKSTKALASNDYLSEGHKKYVVDFWVEFWFLTVDFCGGLHATCH